MNYKTVQTIKMTLLMMGLFFFSSCTKADENKLVGTWYHFDFYKTTNTFYNAKRWQEVKDSLIKQAQEPTAITIRPDYYIKLTLNKDATYTEKTIDIASGDCIDACNDSIHIRKWKINNDSLVLQTKFKGKGLAKKIFKIALKKDEFKAIIIKEISSNAQGIEETYNLSKKETNFKTLIQEIGIDKNTRLSEEWELLNFGKYTILRNFMFAIRGDADSLALYNKRNILYTGIWEQVPYYEPIFEHTQERLFLKKSGRLIINYKVLGSASGKCGTLEQNNFDFGKWHIDLEKNNMTFTFNKRLKKVPFEVKKLFQTTKLQDKYKYKILAKNKAVIILEKQNN